MSWCLNQRGVAEVDKIDEKAEKKKAESFHVDENDRERIGVM